MLDYFDVTELKNQLDKNPVDTEFLIQDTGATASKRLINGETMYTFYISQKHFRFMVYYLFRIEEKTMDELYPGMIRYRFEFSELIGSNYFYFYDRVRDGYVTDDELLDKVIHKFVSTYIYLNEGEVDLEKAYAIYASTNYPDKLAQRGLHRFHDTCIRFDKIEQLEIKYKQKIELYKIIIHTKPIDGVDNTPLNQQEREDVNKVWKTAITNAKTEDFYCINIMDNTNKILDLVSTHYGGELDVNDYQSSYNPYYRDIINGLLLLVYSIETHLIMERSKYQLTERMSFNEFIEDTKIIFLHNKKKINERSSLNYSNITGMSDTPTKKYLYHRVRILSDIYFLYIDSFKCVMRYTPTLTKYIIKYMVGLIKDRSETNINTNDIDRFEHLISIDNPSDFSFKYDILKYSIRLFVIYLQDSDSFKLYMSIINKEITQYIKNSNITHKVISKYINLYYYALTVLFEKKENTTNKLLMAERAFIQNVDDKFRVILEENSYQKETLYNIYKKDLPVDNLLTTFDAKYIDGLYELIKNKLLYPTIPAENVNIYQQRSSYVEKLPEIITNIAYYKLKEDNKVIIYSEKYINTHSYIELIHKLLQKCEYELGSIKAIYEDQNKKYSNLLRSHVQEFNAIVNDNSISGIHAKSLAHLAALNHLPENKQLLNFSTLKLSYLSIKPIFEWLIYTFQEALKIFSYFANKKTAINSIYNMIGIIERTNNAKVLDQKYLVNTFPKVFGIYHVILDTFLEYRNKLVWVDMHMYVFISKNSKINVNVNIFISLDEYIHDIILFIQEILTYGGFYKIQFSQENIYKAIESGFKCVEEHSKNFETIDTRIIPYNNEMKDLFSDYLENKQVFINDDAYIVKYYKFVYYFFIIIQTQSLEYSKFDRILELSHLDSNFRRIAEKKLEEKVENYYEYRRDLLESIIDKTKSYEVARKELKKKLIYCVLEHHSNYKLLYEYIDKDKKIRKRQDKDLQIDKVVNLDDFTGNFNT